MRTIAVMGLFTIGLLASACGDDVVEEVTNTSDCADVCERYSECFNESYDVSACTDRCEDEADADENFESRLDACETCIDDESCTAAVFECTTECAGIVPQ
jgi:hypothetical protein